MDVMRLSMVSNPGRGKNKNKNRRRLDIVRDMLSAASVRVRKTRVMYQANLNHRQVEKYLKILLESGLVELDDDSLYLITGKGKEFLQMYVDYIDRQRKIREEIDGAENDRLLLEDICFNNECKMKRMTNRKYM